MRKRFLVPAAAILLAGALVLLWTALALPPPRLLLRHGLPPVGGPTGRKRTVAQNEFVEVSPGYCRVDRRLFDGEGDLLGRLCGSVGLPWGTKPRPAEGFASDWIEIERPFRIAREPTVTASISSDVWGTRFVGVFEAEMTTRLHFMSIRYESPLRLPTPEELHYAIVAGAVDPGDVLFELTEREGQDILVPANPWWEGREGDLTRHVRDRGPNATVG